MATGDGVAGPRATRAERRATPMSAKTSGQTPTSAVFAHNHEPRCPGPNVRRGHRNAVRAAARFVAAL